MNVEIGWLVTLFAIGFIGSFISGMVGIGGSIIKYPMLLYIPPALGFAAFTARRKCFLHHWRVCWLTGRAAGLTRS